MDTERMRALLAPYLGGRELSEEQLEQLRRYLELLLKWNARMNLTAVRGQDEIVTRHFGESLFAATKLIQEDTKSIIDVGSGAGFPGLPMKIYAPQIALTLIESQNKKATFLKELSRELKLRDVRVFSDRAERLGETADVVTLRAVEKFESVLPIASKLVAPGGRLALLIGGTQRSAAQRVLAGKWEKPVDVPNSSSRVLVVWRNQNVYEPSS